MGGWGMIEKWQYREKSAKIRGCEDVRILERELMFLGKDSGGFSYFDRFQAQKKNPSEMVSLLLDIKADADEVDSKKTDASVELKFYVERSAGDSGRNVPLSHD